MELSTEIVRAFLMNQIGFDEMSEKLGIYEEGFDDYLLQELTMAYKTRDSMRTEYAIYALFIWNEREENRIHELGKFVDILNELLISSWHYKHEDITLLLQKISSEKSINYLYNAIGLHPEYLNWDENYAFEVKCVRAIYYIGREKSYSYLKKLCGHSNMIISEMAKKQFEKLL